MGCTVRVRLFEAGKFFVRGEVLWRLHAAPQPEIAAMVLKGRSSNDAVLS